MKIAVTGHRSQRIKGQEKEIKEWIREILIAYQPAGISLISGMAQGVDQIAALTALEEQIDVECYFAYKHELCDVEKYIADRAAEVRFLEDKYSVGCFTRRDRRMVDDCDLLLVIWDGKKSGGTYYTYMYALEKERNMLMYPWLSLKRGLRRQCNIYDEYIVDESQDQNNEFIGGHPHESN